MTPTPQFQCAGLQGTPGPGAGLSKEEARREPSGWGFWALKHEEARGLGAGEKRPTSQRLDLGAEAERDTGTGRSLRRRRGGAGRRRGAGGGGKRVRGCGRGSGEDPGAAPTWPVGSGRSPSVRPHSLWALPAPSPSPEAGPAGLSGCVRLGWPGAAGGRRLHPDPRRGGAVPARPHPAARPPGTWALRPPGPAPVRSSLSAGAPGALLQVPRGRRSADDLGPRPAACGGCGGPGWGMGDAGGQN